MLQGEKLRHSVFQAAFRRSFGTAEPLLHTKKTFTRWGEAPKGAVVANSIEDLNPDYFEIRYEDGSRRALRRFDFTTEWNNLGYGTIEFGSGVFALPGLWNLPASARVFARVFDIRTNESVGDYAAILENSDGLALWFARPVGPVDGFDWKWVERFVSEEQVGKFGGCPVVRELPAGYFSAFTMRLDCDENIISARPLFELYKARGVPLSLAIKTDQKIGEEEKSFLSEIIASGGSVVSHSHTHAPDWGVRDGRAPLEIQEARRVLSSLEVDGINLDFAVSPFHQNSQEAVRHLQEEGIRGFVSGIACNDPEFLMARSGQVPCVDGVVSISHQCMLHGDCYHQQDSKLDIEKQAFVRSIETETLFGFLDHPFSSYWYGWKSEEERLNAHSEFLDFLMDHPKQWRPSLVEALEFVEQRSHIQIRKTGAAEWEVLSKPAQPKWNFELKMDGQKWGIS